MIFLDDLSSFFLLRNSRMYRIADNLKICKLILIFNLIFSEISADLVPMQYAYVTAVSSRKCF